MVLKESPVVSVTADRSLLYRTVNWLKPNIGLNILKLVKDPEGPFWFEPEQPSEFVVDPQAVCICTKDWSQSANGGNGSNCPHGWICKAAIKELFPHFLDDSNGRVTFKVFMNGIERRPLYGENVRTLLQDKK
jgi:hypothetical protein